MNKEDKELLFRDLCTRLPYNVMCQVDFKEDGKYNSKVMLLSGIFTDEAYFTTKGSSIYSNEYKPYLFPLSSMTEEQERELVDLTGYKSECEAYCGFDSMGYYIKNVGEFEYEEGQHSFKFYPDYIGLDWFNAHHIDYRGLIEMELAIDATDKNIY